MVLIRTASARTLALAILSLVCLVTGCSSLYQPLTPEQQQAQLQNDLSTLFAAKPPLPETLSLEHAIARAVVYNLDHQLDILETSIAREAAGLSTYQQLPRLDLFADHIRRERETTFDQDLEQSTANLSLVWNVLDFGVSYIRSRQAANKALAAEERLLKSANKLAINTHNVYWRALVAEQLEKDIRPLQFRLQQALKNVRSAEQRRLQPPLELLDYQKTLLEILNQIQRLHKELASARITLARLINVKPGTPIRLLSPGQSGEPKTKLPPIEQLEQYALLTRPELREASYQSRIQADETRKAMLRMLPGLEFSVGENFNSGDSYTNNVWAEAGARITWNLMNLLSAPRTIELREFQQEAEELRRLALHISVLSQVQVSYRNLIEARNNHEIASELSKVAGRLFKHASAGQQSVSLSELELIRREADRLLYKIRQQLAYADLQTAKGELYLSLGQPLLPKNSPTLTLEALTVMVNRKFKELQAGNFAGLQYADYSVARPEWKITHPASAASPQQNSSDTQTNGN